MNARLTRNTLFSLATLALCGSVAVAQQPPAQPVPGTPAPIERQAPPPRFPPGAAPAEKAHVFHHTFHGPAGPDDGFHIGPMGMWWKNPGVVQRIGLTPEQTKKMDEIFEQSRLDLIDKKAAVEKAQVMLEPLLSANPIDTAKAMAQIDKVADARAELEKANAKMLLGIRGVLTPDQWTKLRDHRFGAPDGQPAGGGPGRGMRGGPPAGASNLINPIDELF